MRSVGVYEAKTHLARLIEEVARGESIIITKHGVPVAVLSPYQASPSRDVGQVIEAIREFSQGLSLGDITLREAIEEGRRRTLLRRWKPIRS